MSTRLLSPMRKRIYPNARTGTYLQSAGEIVKMQRAGLNPGQADTITWNALIKLGWTIYDGAGQTDERGYVIPGTLEPS
jgi:hypothetical protein